MFNFEFTLSLTLRSLWVQLWVHFEFNFELTSSSTSNSLQVHFEFNFNLTLSLTSSSPLSSALSSSLSLTSWERVKVYMFTCPWHANNNVNNNADANANNHWKGFPKNRGIPEWHQRLQTHGLSHMNTASDTHLAVIILFDLVRH